MTSIINSIIALQAKEILPKKKYLVSSIVIGSILPDIDFILSWIFQVSKIDYLINLNVLNSFFHSVFMIPLLTLLVLIYSEYKKIVGVSTVVIGLSTGMIFHIIFDILTFQSVGILYPLFDSNLNFDLNNYFTINLPYKIKGLIKSSEFIYFYVYGWIIINKIIKNPRENYNMIKKITVWIKLELYIFLLFLFFIYFEVSELIFINTFDIFYILSIMTTMYITFKIRSTID